MHRLIFLLICILYLSACKNDNAQPENYLFAQIGDQKWNANTINSVNTTVAALLAQNSVTVIGTQEADNAKTTLGIIFPENIILNQEINFSPNNKVVLAYAISDTEGYVVDPDKGVSGKLTVTALDKDKNIVEGSFSGEAISYQNGQKIQISNGRFRSKLYATQVTNPPPGKK